MFLVYRQFFFLILITIVHSQMFYMPIRRHLRLEMLFLATCLYGGGSAIAVGVDLASIRALVVQIIGFLCV